jgi:hypothetical protein
MHRPKADSRVRKESDATGSSRLADLRSITVGRLALPDVSRSRSSAFFACRTVASGDVLAGPQVVGDRWAPCAGYAIPRAPQATAVTVNGSEGTRRRQASRSVMRWSAWRLAK